MQVTVRGTCLDTRLANNNFHIRLTNRMCCATHVLINLDMFPMIFNVPWRSVHVVSTHRCHNVRPATSEPDALCSPFCKQYYIPTSAVTSYKTRSLSSPDHSGLFVKSKTLTDFHTIWYSLVLLRFPNEFQFPLNSDNNEHLLRNLQMFLCSSGRVESLNTDRECCVFRETQGQWAKIPELPLCALTSWRSYNNTQSNLLWAAYLLMGAYPECRKHISSPLLSCSFNPHYRGNDN
jgi:hypothetical protein